LLGVPLPLRFPVPDVVAHVLAALVLLLAAPMAVIVGAPTAIWQKLLDAVVQLPSACGGTNVPVAQATIDALPGFSSQAGGAIADAANAAFLFSLFAALSGLGSLTIALTGCSRGDMNIHARMQELQDDENDDGLLVQREMLERRLAALQQHMERLRVEQHYQRGDLPREFLAQRARIEEELEALRRGGYRYHRGCRHHRAADAWYHVLCRWGSFCTFTSLLLAAITALLVVGAMLYSPAVINTLSNDLCASVPPPTTSVNATTLPVVCYLQRPLARLVLGLGILAAALSPASVATVYVCLWNRLPVPPD
jgi:hypothetical protein